MQTNIKIDLKNLIDSGEKLAIELGCGQKKKDGYIGIDKIDLPSVDIVADLEEGLPFLPDDSVDEVHCKSFLEHISNFENLMREITRVLKPGGKSYVFVPHFSNPYHYSDYTHTRFFGLYSFYYFVDSAHQLKRKVPNFYTDIRIEIVRIKLIFKSPFWLRHRFKKLISLLFNLHRGMQEFYEENLCYIFPCYGIELEFRLPSTDPKKSS